MKNIACSWSGGKDCCFALMEAKSMGYTPKVLLSMVDEDLKTSRSHGLPVSILEEQAEAMNLTLLATPSSRNDYEQNFIKALKCLKTDFEIETIVFGDIDLIAHYEWLERVCRIAGIEPVFPLWNRKREVLAKEIVNSGIKSMIVSCNERLGESYLGKIYSSELIEELKPMSVCPCGEDGEFHSFVIDGPLFQYQVSIPKLPAKKVDDFYFIDWGI